MNSLTQHITLAGYGLTTCAFLIYLPRYNRAWGTAGKILLALSFCSHLLSFGFNLNQVGLAALTQMRGIISLLILLSVGIFFVYQFKREISIVGAILAPMATILLYTAISTQSRGIAPTQAAPLLKPVHIMVNIIALVVFGVAFFFSTLYLLQEFQLKTKKFWFLKQRIPSLQTLQQWSYIFVFIGFPLYTAGIILGMAWIAQITTDFYLDAHHYMSIFSWFIFAVLIHARITMGWKGKRVATLTIIGFLSTLSVALSYILRSHG